MKKRYTRVKSAVLALILLLSAFAGIPVTAEATAAEPAVFTVTSVKGVAGKTVDVEVRVSENAQICAGDWELRFDSSRLLFEAFEAGEPLGVGMYAYNANVSDCVKVSFSSLEPVTAGGMLFKVTFLLTSQEYNERLDVDFAVSNLVTSESSKASYSVRNGHVEIVDVLYGDIDRNNRISAVDVLYVLRSLTGEAVLTEEQTKIADVNGDGEVTIVDALQILYFTAEMGDTLFTTDEGQMDFFIYNLQAPQNVRITDLHEYSFTVGWDAAPYAIGYNVYFNGEKINQTLLKQLSVTIGCTATSEIVGDASIAKYLHNSIDHNTEYVIEVSAVNALKESEKSPSLSVKTKRHHSSVVFKNWDGTVLDEQKVLYGQNAVVPNNPTRTGYNFIGWDKPTTNITDDVVITALYEIQKFQYIFRDQDGRQLSEQTVVYQGTATPPADPVREGYTFVGWYTAAIGGERVIDFSNATASHTFYAQYTVNRYTVSFNAMGGTAVSSYTGDFGSKVLAPANPTRYSYVFGGWYTDAACMQPWKFNTDCIRRNTTLYAKWIPIVLTIDRSKLNFTTIGTTQQLTVSFSSGSDTVKWYSDNTAVAAVDVNTGLVTSKGHGTANIYIEGANSARRAVCVVTVVAKKDAWISRTGSIGLNLRQYATTGSAALAVIPDGQQITVYGDAQNGWLQAEYAGKRGWVHADYVVFKKPTVQAPSALTGSFAERLAKLRRDMPDGWYWNHLTVEGHNNNGIYGECTNPDCMKPNSVTQFPCTSHAGTVGVGGYDCNSFDGALQCCGFARYVFWRVHDGQHVSSAQWVSPTFDNIRAGDVLWIDKNWNIEKDPGHWVFVIEKGTNYIKTVEANYHSHGFNIPTGCQCCNCKIRWDIVRWNGQFTLNEIWRAR